MTISSFLVLALYVAVSHGSPVVSRWNNGNNRLVSVCPSDITATYNVTIYNLLTPSRFPNANLPESGLVLSPPALAAHSSRVSILTVRGYASPAIEAIAENGDNSLLVSALTALNNTEGGGVRSLAAATGPVPAGGSVSLQVTADCNNSILSGVAMIAPSPDWIIQFSNINLLRKIRTWRGVSEQFVSVQTSLQAYDSGTDSGADLTDPADTTLDVPTEPKLNIAPLVEDDTDRFGGKRVSFVTIRRIM